MTSEQMEQLEQIDAQIRRLQVVEWVLRGIALAALAAIVTLVVACGGTPPPKILSVHGGGGITIEWSGHVARVDFREAGVPSSDGGLVPCTVVEALDVDGYPIGSGAVEAVSAPECEAVYGWFPAGPAPGAGGMGQDGGDVGP